MKISNSKKQLAMIIHENGGWCEGAGWAAQDKLGIQAIADEVAFYEEKPQKPEGGDMWNAKAPSATVLDSFPSGGLLNNWHQTILSRAEYFHLYPAPVEVVVENKTTCHLTVTDKPTIEQLAADYRNRKDYADRKQQEADAAKADANAKLVKLVAAGKALGLVLSVAADEPEMVITDWRDLRVGDYVEFNGVSGEWEILDLESEDDGAPIKVDESIDCECIVCGWVNTNVHKWRFIRRPSKGGTNA